MAPKYKLTYFSILGLAEPIRFLLSYGNLDFADIRLNFQDWPKIKPTIPFGKVPTLEIDGKQAHQSIAICRYLAKQLKLVGKNDWDALQIDSVVDTIIDLRTQIFGYAFDQNEDSKAQKLEPLLKETLPFYLSKLDKIVADNGGYFVGGQLTWADLYFAAISDFFQELLKKDLFEDYANLKSLKKKVSEIPQIKAWIAKRPAA